MMLFSTKCIALICLPHGWHICPANKIECFLTMVVHLIKLALEQGQRHLRNP